MRNPTADYGEQRSGDPGADPARAWPRIAVEDSPEGVEIMAESVAISVQNGLRATLESGNILTGARLIELDVYETETVEELGDFLGYPTIPTISGGLAHIQVQISQLLDKINKLAAGRSCWTRAESALVVELEGTLKAVRTIRRKRRPAGPCRSAVQATLDELNEVLESFSTATPSSSRS